MAEQISAHSRVVISSQQRSADLESGEKVILNYKDGMYYSLRDVAKRVWELLQEPRRVEQVVAILIDEYDVEPARCTAELTELIGDLEKRGLVEISNQAAA
jgi:hypothetical protein